jgi:translation initiation factor 1
MKKKPPPIDAPSGPFNSAFAKLRERLPDDAPAAPSARATSAPPRAPSAPTPPARAVIRLERKGRGGKEATVVEKLGLSPAALAEWADALKRSLGIGGGVEGDAIVLQGDQRERTARWLEAKGVRKVVRG